MDLNGLRAIIENTATLHGIEAPPERADYESDETHARAYSDWYDRVTFWRATVEGA